MKPEERIIIALDVDEKDQALSLVKHLSPAQIFKIGSRLFLGQGIPILEALEAYKKKIFLDLKFHDIPHTVAGAVKQAVHYRIFMLTLHASGGQEMMKRAVESAQEEAEKYSLPRPKLLAVTMLTSLQQDDLKDIGFHSPMKEQVLRLALLAKESGVDGLVCSPQEIEILRKNLGEEILLVTPGIRPAWSQKNDQKRALTPQEAVLKGADYLVIGRPIIASSHPEEAFQQIISEMSKT